MVYLRRTSTIVEIIEAYSLVDVYPQFHISTIVEIIEAYSPLIDCKDTTNPLNKGFFE